MRSLHPWLASLAFGASWLCAPAANAQQDTGQCIQSYEQAQVLRKEGRLLEARERLTLCGSDECPSALRTDCLPWLSEVEAAIPTIVVKAMGADGQDAVDVRVSIDGETAMDRLDGRAYSLDPGVHVFRFESPGQEPKEQTITVRQGEKNRAIEVSWFEKPETPTPTAELTTADRPVPLSVPILAGIGAAGLVGFGVFGVLGRDKESELRATCRPFCEESEIDEVKRSYLLADISLGVGVVSLAAASYLFFTRPEIERGSQPASPGLDVAVTPDGWFANYERSF